MAPEITYWYNYKTFMKPPSTMERKDDSRIVSSWKTFWSSNAKPTMFLVAMSSLNLLLLLLATMAWIYGTTFDQKSRVNALSILLVDFDEGFVGGSVIHTARTFTDHNIPSIEIKSAEDFVDVGSVRHAVCRADYWAAVYTHRGASDRWSSILNGTSSEYDPTDTVTYVYNHARYPTVAEAYLSSNLHTLIGASSRAVQQSREGLAALDRLNISDVASVAAYLDPIHPSADLIQPTPQASRALYNTFNIVIPPLAQFFLILALNGIGAAFGVLAATQPRDVWIFRFCVGKIYSFLCALVMTGCMWAFREEWSVDGGVFAKTWMIIWFVMDINWQVMESIIGSFLPMAYTPFFVLPWIVTNIASTLWPVELMPSFYRISYAFPMRAAYVLQIEAWSSCRQERRIVVPVLVAWWFIGHVTAVFSIRKRCRDAAEAGNVGSAQAPLLNNSKGS